eukprot:scaffold15799_cov19-Prasinocladus_malaysianus.AAC.1
MNVQRRSSDACRTIMVSASIIYGTENNNTALQQKYVLRNHVGPESMIADLCSEPSLPVGQ